MKGEQAGTTLRGALLGLLDPSVDNAEMMETMGIKITDAQGNFVGLANLIDNLTTSMEGQTETQKAATLASLVGKEAVSGMLSLMKVGPDEIRRLTTALEDSGGASKEAADKMKDNLAGQLEELGGSIETLSIKLGNILIPIVRDAAKWLQEVVDKFSNLSPETQKAILMFGAFVAAVGPILMITGSLISSVGSIIGVLGKLGGAFGMSLGSVGKFGSVFGRLLPIILRFIPGVGLIVTAISMLVGAFELAGVDILSGLSEGLKTGLKIALDAIKWIGEQIIGLFKALFGIASPSKLFNQFGVWIMQGLANGIKSMVRAVTGLFTGLFGSIKRIASTGIAGVKGIASAGFTAISNGARSMASNITSAVSSAFSSAVSAAGSFAEKAKTLGSNIASGISSGISSGKQWVSNAVSGLSQKAQNVFKNDNEIKSPSRLYKRLAAFLPDGVQLAIKEGIPKVANAMKDLAQTTNEKFTTTFNVDAIPSFENIAGALDFKMPSAKLDPSTIMPGGGQQTAQQGFVIQGNLIVQVQNVTDLTPQQLQNQAERQFFAKARQKE